MPNLDRSLGKLGEVCAGNANATTETSLKACTHDANEAPTAQVKMSDFIVTACIGPIATDTTPNESQWFHFEFDMANWNGVTINGGPPAQWQDHARMGGNPANFTRSEYYNGYAYNAYDNSGSGWRPTAVSNAISSNVTAKLNMKYHGDDFNGAITNNNTMISETVVFQNSPGGGPGG